MAYYRINKQRRLIFEDCCFEDYGFPQGINNRCFNVDRSKLLRYVWGCNMYSPSWNINLRFFDEFYFSKKSRSGVPSTGLGFVLESYGNGNCRAYFFFDRTGNVYFESIISVFPLTNTSGSDIAPSK